NNNNNNNNNNRNKTQKNKRKHNKAKNKKSTLAPPQQQVDRTLNKKKDEHSDESKNQPSPLKKGTGTEMTLQYGSTGHGELKLTTTVHALEPMDTCEMVSWFDMSLGWVLLDVVMTLGVFIDRFDRRTLMAALQKQLIAVPSSYGRKHHSSRLRFITKKDRSSYKKMLTPPFSTAGRLDDGNITSPR
ncbi:UBX domain-containing protein, partial [Reticulomyxa filosa]